MNRHLTRHLIFGFFLLFLISCGVSEIKETAAPVAPAFPKPGDCNACHEDKEVLPSDHIDTKGMTGNECSACHVPGPTSLWAKIPLSHIHQQNGVSCKDCHEDPESAEPADSTVCEKCHGDTQALVEAASELEINPHFSPHEGSIPDCNKCHHQHKSSENYCANCHGMQYVVP